MIRVMMVCSGNICRSPLAHRLLEHLADERGLSHLIEVESSGTGPWHVGDEADGRMRAVAKGHGFHLSHRARQLSAADLARYDLILAMDRSHIRDIEHLARRSDVSLDGKLFLFRQFDPEDGATADRPAPRERAGEVPDPYYGGPEGFEHVYRLAERTNGQLLEMITAGSVVPAGS